jgi:hypothetical protein
MVSVLIPLSAELAQSVLDRIREARLVVLDEQEGTSAPAAGGDAAPTRSPRMSAKNRGSNVFSIFSGRRMRPGASPNSRGRGKRS